MDIPNTGAIFTLGKSYLAENTQSYFYIKNDPIKRLIAGPYQSAVICESGRLFVWGENHYGQLGIGGHLSNGSNQHNNNNNNNNGDIITKPTCVKSLKVLGLKVADIAYGHDWSVILTFSNELFFTGRNIFSSESPVSSNFTEATVNEEPCEIIRKPFRLEEFDDCLADNEEAENFVSVLAGNEHFVVLTSFGRLIGWGSNQANQLGSSDEALLAPHEIVLDSPIRQFACGPKSTLVLTEKGNLYLTGHLNEFVFTQFTELQKNLSPNEQIVFVHISHASEIFIVTNGGSIYRSLESLRNKSLIFQRFYDYDSEENGPIWKLLKGTSFYAVLTKVNKFYTTFSESGHHLKTFREISKFKNLRLLDMALGDQHVLVHGLPRSSALAASMGPAAEHLRVMSQSTIMANTTGGLMGRMKNTATTSLAEANQKSPQMSSAFMEAIPERPKTNTPVHETISEGVEDVGETDGTPQNGTTDSNNNLEEGGSNNNHNHNSAAADADAHLESDHLDNSSSRGKSPTESLKSRKSVISLKKSQNNSLRPRTPYPEGSSASSSPQTAIKKTPVQDSSYAKALNEDNIDHTSPRLVGSLENIPESIVAKPGLSVSTPTPPTEDDEQLTVEIRETTDPLDHTVTINEIRFINNGIDVTANVKKDRLDSEDSADETDDEEDSKSTIRKQAEDFIEHVGDEVDETVEKVQATKAEAEEAVKEKANTIGEKVGSKFTEAKESLESAAKGAGESVETKFAGAKDTVESAAMKAASGAMGAVEAVTENAKKAAKGAKHTMENVGNTAAKATDDARQALETMGSNAAKATGEAKDSMGNALRKMAGDTRHAVGAVTSKISHEVQDAKNSLSSLLQGKKHNKVDVEIVPPPDNGLDAIEELNAEISAKDSGGSKTLPTSQSTNTPGGAQEDDERTTASVNSAHTSAGNPFENNNPFEGNNPFDQDATVPFDPELDAMIERSKKAFQEDMEAASMATENRLGHVEEVVVEEKSKFSKFFQDMREKSKNLSCRNEKAVQIIEDQPPPPRYSEQDELALQPANMRPENGSKICTIL
ncbi:X-linked retinitis pigmentosa GTPase regulator [Stomoxys calcitrans]|uniref:X-linked retinitis pigmentosa GTPase regulator n=1 Tax=Stomoxys calcitrans TaxID=35570 RepID=UPI0027E31F27|nr:X-linked retinitis pigmentosa GTPase regulator [Stomoxys calcitrans]